MQLVPRSTGVLSLAVIVALLLTVGILLSFSLCTRGKCFPDGAPGELFAKKWVTNMVTTPASDR